MRLRRQNPAADALDRHLAIEDAIVGSPLTNLDWRSFVHNHALDAVVLGTEFGQQVRAMFDRDLAESDEVLLAQWVERPPTLRLLEWFSGLWAYWL